MLNWIARRTVGFAGADLHALCTQAAIIALRRNCPLQEILSVAEKKASHGKRPPLPTFAVEERDWLESLACAPPPSSQRGAGMAANYVVSSPLRSHLIPCLRQPLSRLLVSLYLDERLLLPPHLYKAATLVKSVIVSALDKEKVSSDHWWFRVHDLLQEADVLRVIEINLSRGGILIRQASDSNFDDWGEGTNNDSLKYKYPKDQQIGTRPSLLQNISYASAKKLGFSMLIFGSPRSGQRYLASCLLHCFVQNVEIQKVDLATISQEGHGDVTQGVTRILRGNDASHSAEATARRGSTSFARPDVDMHSRSGMATLSTIGVVASAMGLAVENSSKVPDITTALMDAKLGTEGRKDLFDWLSRQLSGLSCVVGGLNIFGWMCMDNKY